VSFRPIRARIDLAALKHNLKQVRRLAPKSRVMAVIKANGYGHGLLTVAKALNQADGFAVASLDEAIQLRQAGFLHPILLLEGVFSESEWQWVLQHRLDAVVHHREQLESLKNLKIPSPAQSPTLWVKVDTGMHRLGFLPSEVPEVKKALKDWPNQIWMSHFATADENLDFAKQQLEQFLFLSTEKHPKSIANSAAIQSIPESHLDWVRPGIMLYGAAEDIQSTQRTQDISPFKPVMHLEAQVIALKQLQAGDCVGYGCSYVANSPVLMAVLAAGYGDGYLRQIANHPDARVAFQHYRLPIIGRISMDMMTVDATAVAIQIQVGDWVQLWGDQISVQEVAGWAQTIPYELLCGITQRVPRK